MKGSGFQLSFRACGKAGRISSTWRWSARPFAASRSEGMFDLFGKPAEGHRPGDDGIAVAPSLALPQRIHFRQFFPMALSEICFSEQFFNLSNNYQPSVAKSVSMRCIATARQ
jgi:hypothetical protein